MHYGNCKNKHPAMAASMNAAAARILRDFMPCRTSVRNDRHGRRHRHDFMGRRIATESFAKSGDDWIRTARRRYIYQGWNVIAEYVNGARNKTYVWGEDLSGELQGAGGVGGLLLEQNACGDYLPVYDGNGNIIAYKNEEGSVISTYAYDPFGNVIAHAGMDFTYKFSTKPQDELSGMYYYGYRFYQPELGRWINRDPARETGGNNFYHLAFNSAVNYYDILGLACCAGVQYDSQKECCENGKVVSKVNVWKGRRKLSFYNNWPIPRIPGLSHVVYTKDEAVKSNRSGTKLPKKSPSGIIGKVPGGNPIISKGEIVDESKYSYKYSDYEWESDSIKMCPAEADKLLKEGTENAGTYMAFDPAWLPVIINPSLLTIISLSMTNPIWGNSRCGNCAGWGR